MGPSIGFFSFSILFGLLNILNPIYSPITNIEEVVLVQHEEVVVSVESDEDLLFFEDATYNSIYQELFFQTNEPTVQIRIYDDFESMVYLLPVKSDRIKIGKSLFESGKYTVVFDVEGDRRRFASKLEIK